MAIILDHQLREHIPHTGLEFPITYFHDELVTLPDRTEPVALLVMGYPSSDAEPLELHFKTRPMEDVVFYDSF